MVKSRTTIKFLQINYSLLLIIHSKTHTVHDSDVPIGSNIGYQFSVLEITVGHWPFSNQFQHLTDQNPFWSANFSAHFQWDGNQ